MKLTISMSKDADARQEARRILALVPARRIKK
jgi:hypothetical protein